MTDEEKLEQGYSPRANCILCGVETVYVEDGGPHICVDCHSKEGRIEQALGVAAVG